MKTMGKDEAPTSGMTPAGGAPKGNRGAVPVPNFKKRGVRGFIQDVRAEAKKVHWPTRQEAMRLTGVVIAVCMMAVTILGVLSYGFGYVLELLFKSRG
ncbi:MAG: preprotein translocase subunit SecE [Armatimonadetes bacterium]|nr:preprotein translocase subunit SecE [Armatimonadota bacterium]